MQEYQQKVLVCGGGAGGAPSSEARVAPDLSDLVVVSRHEGVLRFRRPTAEALEIHRSIRDHLANHGFSGWVGFGENILDMSDVVRVGAEKV